MERLSIQEIIDHCERQLKREPVGSIFYREHEAVKAYLLELLQFRDIDGNPAKAASRAALYMEILTRTYGPIKQKIAEWLKADQADRLVVLPCKLGDAVYRIYDDCDFPGDCGTKRMCKGCEYRNVFIEEQAFCISMLNQNGTFGNPYYLTREEAEAALRKEETE